MKWKVNLSGCPRELAEHFATVNKEDVALRLVKAIQDQKKLAQFHFQNRPKAVDGLGEQVMVLDPVMRRFHVGEDRELERGSAVTRLGLERLRLRDATLIAIPQGQRDGHTQPEELIARMTPVDVLLIEGFKREGHDKLEVWRAATGKPLLAREDRSILAVASDGPVPGVTVPVLDLDNVPSIADFILAHCGLTARG